MKIAINFGDNDFYSTWYPVMDTLYNAYKYNGAIPTNKKELVIILQNLSYGFYLLFQNSFIYGEEKDHKISFVKQYLEDIEDRILINEEVDDYLSQDTGGGNSSTFILNTDLYNNNVYCI